jgi:hypothetical protein
MQFCYVTETSSIQYLLLMQSTWKKPTRGFSLLGKLWCDAHQWNICADLKVVALQTGLQGGCTHLCCFLCEWGSRTRDVHYDVKQWPLRGEMIIGENNVAHRALVDKTKIYFPPLYIQFGLIKIFVKAMNKEDEGFIYVRQKCLRISETKIKEKAFSSVLS